MRYINAIEERVRVAEAKEGFVMSTYQPTLHCSLQTAMAEKQRLRAKQVNRVRVESEYRKWTGD